MTALENGSAETASSDGNVRTVPDRQAYRRFALVSVVVALLFGLVPFGATGPFAMPIAACAVALAALIASPLACVNASQRRLERAAIALAFVLALYVALQSTDVVSLLPPHPIWASAAALLDVPHATTASVAPALSFATIPTLVTPFLLFAAGLRVSWSDTASVGLLKILAGIGGIVALFGILQFVLMPTTLLISEKLAYQDSLTLVFVNRNTAATYLGSTLVVLVALLRIEVGRLGFRRAIGDLLLRNESLRRRRMTGVYLLLIGVVSVALLLSKSRAGIACSFVAVAFYAFLEAYLSASRRKLASVAAAALVVAAISLAFLVFGGRVIGRAQTDVLDDARFCVLPAIWAAARDNWPVGTGAGTFELVFQGYRDPSCGLYGVWRRAHNFFLEGSVTLGAAFWVALAIALTVLLATLIRGSRVRRRHRSVPIAGLAVLLLVFLHDMVDFSLQIPGLAYNTALLLAASCSIALGVAGKDPRAAAIRGTASTRDDASVSGHGSPRTGQAR